MRTRHGRLAAGFVATLSLAAASCFALVAAPAAAAPPDPFTPWASCAGPTDTYCIESATRDGLDLLDAGTGGTLAGKPLGVNVSLLDANSVNFAVDGPVADGWSLPPEIAGQTIRLVLRTGDLEPLFTTAIADEFYLSKGGDAENGWTLTVEGTATVVNWLNDTSDGNCYVGQCGDDTTVADTTIRKFSGNSQNMALWNQSERDMFGGMYIATNAQYRPTVVQYFVDFGSLANYWYLQLGNPHLQTDGETPATGSFTAWVPPNYFAAMAEMTNQSMSAASAVAQGFTIDRVDNGVTTQVPGAASLVDGGAYLRIPSLHYSSPQLNVKARTSGAKTTFVPNAPRVGTATAGAGSVTVPFTPPRFDGGSSITGYRVSCTQGVATKSVAVASSAQTATVTGLLTGQSATCSVVARNATGSSGAATAAAVTPTGPVKPGAVGSLKAKVGAGRAVTATWKAPAVPGQSAVTKYRVQVRRGAKVVRTFDNVIATNLSMALAALPPGSYSVAVAARSAKGVGTYATVPITLR